MNRIDSCFEQLKAKGEKAFIPFVTAGDPNLDTTKKLVLAMEQNGADLIELGVPFTDPMAEGPVIQAANLRALKHDVSLNRLFEMVADLRVQTQIPLVFLMYYNSLLHYGAEKFFQRCVESGVDGIIVPDLPFEESDEISAYTQKYEVYQISMVAPTSHDRMKQICASAKGFLYCVSSLGVTGMRSEIKTNLDAFFGDVQKVCTIPTAIGFGISSPEQAAEMMHYTDGVIIGSAVVQQIADAENSKDAVKRVANFVKAVTTAMGK